jgi:hypothetical protein
MKFQQPTRRQVINLSDEGYRRLLAAANGLGKGAFVEMALRHAMENRVEPSQTTHFTHQVYAQVLTDWKDSPSLLGARLETVLSQLSPPERPAGPHEEMIFNLPREFLVQFTLFSLRRGWFPHEALGDFVEKALRHLDTALDLITDEIEPLAVPVDPVLFHRVMGKARARGFQFDSVMATYLTLKLPLGRT